MSNRIRLSLIEKDDDYERFEIAIFDEDVQYGNFIYLNVGGLDNLVFILSKFKVPTYKGSCPLAFGGFAPNDAGGALKALLSYDLYGKICIEVTLVEHLKTSSENKQQHQFVFSATRGKLVQFIDELSDISSGQRVEANFELD